MKQNLPHGVLNAVNNCDSCDIGRVQKTIVCVNLGNFLDTSDA